MGQGERAMAGTGAASAGRSGLVVRLAGTIGLIPFLLGAGDRIDPGEPAVEIHVGAAPRAERGEPLGLGLAADDAGFRRRR
jgi:hypothetical protein